MLGKFCHGKVRSCLAPLLIAIVFTVYVIYSLLPLSLFSFNKVQDSPFSFCHQDNAAAEQARFFRHSLGNTTADDVLRWLLDRVGQLCSNVDSCLFEQRHMPPFLLSSLSQQTVDVLRRLRESTLLVVMFNRDTTYYTAPLVHVVYSKIFKEIRYCGQSQNGTTFAKGIARYFPTEVADYFASLYLSFQDPAKPPISKNAGETSYYCTNLALQQADNISGVFMMQDDVFLSYWQFAFFPNSLDLNLSYSIPGDPQPYDIETMMSCNSADSEGCTKVNYWQAPPVYFRQTLDFYKDLEEAAKNSSSSIASCVANISRVAGGSKRIFGGAADIYYVAARHFPAVLPFFELAKNRQMFQEIIIPTVFSCLDQSTIGKFDGSGATTEPIGRRTPWEEFDARRIVMHPFKMSSIVRAMFCDRRSKSENMPEICLYCLLAQYSVMLTDHLSSQLSRD